MKLTRKAIEDEIWENKAGSEIPGWVKAIAEPRARAGSTFLIHSAEYGNRLVPAGYFIVRGPTDIYPCSPAGLAASYEVPSAPAHEPSTADPPVADKAGFQSALPKPPTQTFGTKKG